MDPHGVLRPLLSSNETNLNRNLFIFGRHLRCLPVHSYLRYTSSVSTGTIFPREAIADERYLLEQVPKLDR